MKPSKKVELLINAVRGFLRNHRMDLSATELAFYQDYLLEQEKSFADLREVESEAEPAATGKNGKKK